MGAEDLSVREYLDIYGDDAGLRGLRWKITTCSKLRVELIEEALTDFYGRLVDARKDKEKLSENTLTRHLADMLTACGIPAIREEDVNGHCDLVIRASRNFLWLGEAKVHSSYEWLDDGFKQLSTRYGTAMEGRDHGELIIYHRGGDSRNVLKIWKERLIAANDNVVISEDIKDQHLYFRTEHKCANSGCTFYTRHHIVPLMHDPKK